MDGDRPTKRTLTSTRASSAASTKAPARQQRRAACTPTAGPPYHSPSIKRGLCLRRARQRRPNQQLDGRRRQRKVQFLTAIGWTLQTHRPGINNSASEAARVASDYMPARGSRVPTTADLRDHIKRLARPSPWRKPLQTMRGALRGRQEWVNFVFGRQCPAIARRLHCLPAALY